MLKKLWRFAYFYAKMSSWFGCSRLLFAYPSVCLVEDIFRLLVTSCFISVSKRVLCRTLILTDESTYTPTSRFLRWYAQNFCTSHSCYKPSTSYFSWPNHLNRSHEICRKVFFFWRVRKISKKFIFLVVSVCPSAWNNSPTTGWILIKLDIWIFFENMSRNVKFR